jgi:hypothetical protein
MPIACLGCHGDAGTVKKDIDRLFGRIEKQQKSGREKEFEVVELKFLRFYGHYISQDYPLNFVLSLYTVSPWGHSMYG